MEILGQAHKGSKAVDWEIATHEALGGHTVGAFTGGRMDEKGNEGGGWYVEGEGGYEVAGDYPRFSKIRRSWSFQTLARRLQ